MRIMTVIELAEQEIDALKYAICSESDMSDYIHDFPKYTSKDLLHVLESLVKENKQLKIEVERYGKIEAITKRYGAVFAKSGVLARIHGKAN